MNARTALVAHGEPTKAMQPGERSLDDPARAAEPTAVTAAIAVGDQRCDATSAQLRAVPFGVVSAIALHAAWATPGRAGAPADGGHGIHQIEQLRDVGTVGGGQRRDERNPVRVGENMMFRPGLATIGRVRSSFFPPRNARSDALSTTARARSSWPPSRNSASSTACNRFHTPARCQRTSRRQHVVPEPQPISRGSMFQGSPLRSTNRMPVRTARSGIGLRPAYRRWRERRFGRSGSIRFHNSSSINGLVMHDRLLVGHAKVPSSRSKYKSGILNFETHSKGLRYGTRNSRTDPDRDCRR